MTEGFRRRRFLLLTAGVGGFTGCLTAGPSDEETEHSPTTRDRRTSTAQTPSETTTPEAIEQIAASLQYVTPKGADGSRKVLANADRQYVIVTFRDDGSDAAETTLHLDGEKYTHSFTAAHDGRLDVGFDVPRDVTAAEGSIRFEGTSYPVYRDVLDRLANPPRFTETEFDVQEDVSPGGFLGLDVQTWNKGDTGPFKGVFRVPDAPSKVFSKTIDSGTLSRTSTYVTINEDATAGERTAVFDTGFKQYTQSFTVKD